MKSGVDGGDIIIAVVTTLVCAALGFLGGLVYPFLGTPLPGKSLSTILMSGAAGAFAGPVLYWTRAWRRENYVKALLRWTLAGAAAGLGFAFTRLFTERVSVGSVMASVIVLAFLFTLSRWAWWAELRRGEENPREPAEVKGQLAIVAILAALVLVVVLLAPAV
jgi:hypothetical protein